MTTKATVIQGTSKATGVTINAFRGQITLNAAALADATNVKFTVTNSKVLADDNIVVNHKSGGTTGVYGVNANNIADGSFDLTVRNNSGGSLSEAPVLTFSVIRMPTVVDA